MLLLVLIVPPIHFIAQNYRFDRISLEQGLSQSTVYWITQDKKGFMWFGTQDGLNRYDGYKFKIYKNEPNNPYSLSHNDVYTIHVDDNNIFWIGTDGRGLNKFDPKTGKFYRFLNNQNDSNSISDDYIRSIKEDGKGNLWIGTFNGGLNKFNKETEKFTHYRHNKSNTNSISSDKIESMDFDKNGLLWIATNKNGLNQFNPNSNLFKHYKKEKGLQNNIGTNDLLSVFCDKDNNLWIGSNGNGLVRYSIEMNQFSHFKHDYNNQNSISHNNVKIITQDNDGNFWLGTEGGGLNKYNVSKNKFTSYEFIRGDEYSLSSNHVISICRDAYGTFWLGTYGGGVSKFTPSQNKFVHFKNEPGNPNSISHNQVDALFQEDHGELWIGSYGGGISVLNSNTNKFKHFMFDPYKPDGISSNIVRSIMTDVHGNYWIGTYGKGLDMYDPKTGIFSHYLHDENDSTSLSHNKVRSIVKDKSGELWIATFGGGLNKLVKNKDGKYEFKRLYHDPKSLNSITGNRIMVLMLDNSDNLWIGAFGSGVDILNKKRDKFHHFRHDPNDINSISTNNVLCIYEANNGIVWIGTFGGGVNSINRSTGEIKRYSTKEGLSNDVVYGVLEDEKGKLWMSTNKGLSVFNPETNLFRNYSVKDGLQSDEFNSGAYLKSADGKMYFGGINGLNSFYPWEIIDNPIIPDVAITGFYIFNKAVQIDENISSNNLVKTDNSFYASKDIPYSEEIILTYKENVFSIEFSALHFTVPEQNKYAYKMENFEKEWNYVSSERRYVTYTNLNPGTYYFQVKATNNDGVWNEEGARLKIVITPPFWRTWWFFLLCVVIGLLATYFILNSRIDKIKMKAEKEYFKKQNEEKIYMMKEVHHRVKNNLQIVNSLLRLQSNEIQDEKILAMFKESQTRILSMARLHEQLYQSEDVKHIDIKHHFTTLIENLIHEYQVDININLKIKVEEVDIGIKTLVPLGLMINEIITNSLKHAFKGRKEGEIMVHIKHFNDNQYVMIIGDDGIGFSRNQVSSGLGSELIQIFTEQLNGVFSKVDKPGTIFKLIFEKIDKT